MLVFGLLPTHPSLDIVCCVLCYAYAFAKQCACQVGGGVYAYACIKCVGCYECVCVMHPPTHCDNLFLDVLPILPL